MSKPIVGWFEITGKDGPALQQFYSGLFADPEGHVVGLSKGAVQ